MYIYIYIYIYIHTYLHAYVYGALTAEEDMLPLLSFYFFKQTFSGRHNADGWKDVIIMLSLVSFFIFILSFISADFWEDVIPFLSLRRGIRKRDLIQCQKRPNTLSKETYSQWRP